MTDKIKQIQSKLSESFQGGNISAAAAYIPLFGWLYPYIAKKGDSFYHFHARQSMYLNLLIVVVYFAIWLLEYFPITALLFGPGHVLHPVSRTVWLLAALAYIVSTAFAAKKAYNNEKWNIPYLDALIQKIFDYIKDLKSS